MIGDEKLADMGNVLDFTVALSKEWWPLMSCAAFTLLSLGIALKNKGSNWIVGGTAVLAICFFFIAAFKTWNGERATVMQKLGEIDDLKRTIVALNQPDLYPEILAVNVAEDKAGNAIIILSVQIINKGANSSVSSNRVEIQNAGGTGLHLNEVVPPMGNIHLHGMNGDPKLTMTLISGNFLPRVLDSGPIVRGGNASGWVIFATADAKPEQVRQAGTLVTFVCSDFNKKEYSFTYRTTGIPTIIYNPEHPTTMRP